ncbi:MAG: Fic family protein [Sandaracinaceae bacterium]
MVRHAQPSPKPRAGAEGAEAPPPQPAPVRTFTADEERRLSENLFGIARDIRRGAYDQVPVRVDLLRALHGRLFDGVRSHAGRLRGPGFGQEILVFGPNQSAHRNDVAARLDDVLERASRSVRSCEDHPDDPRYEEAAFQVAVWLHFEDGNGRTSRALMNVVLHRLGLRPVVVTALKQEYNAALNHYFTAREIDVLVDLLLPTD